MPPRSRRCVDARVVSSRPPNPHALRVRLRDTAKALDSSPIESRRNSRSDLRPPARSPPQKLGSEQAALEVSLERARAIVAPRDAPYASDEDDDVLTHYQLGDVGRSVPTGVPEKYAFGTRPGPGLDTISPPKAGRPAPRGARGALDGDAAPGASASDPVFKEESLEEAFRRYDVDGSGFLDFGEASVALADMGALEGVLASKAGELFDRFDVDGDGQVDLDEFRELASQVRELRGSVDSKPAPEVPEGFAESAAALALRKSFEAFAAFGKGNRVGEAIEHINGRDWSKLVKDCGLVGGSVNAPAADIIFARSVPKGQRVLRWEDGSFLAALAVVAAEHRVTFGQVAQRVSQCAPKSPADSAEAAGAGASERAAAAAARAAAESANGPPPGADATSRAALRSIFAQYADGKGADGKGGLGHLNALDVLHALSDVGALRRQSPETALTLVTRAIDESLGSAPAGAVAFEAFERCASALTSRRAAARGAGAYKPPDDVQMLSDQRRALRASFEAFAGPTASYGMRPEQWEATVRACGLVGAKCSETTAAVIFAKCKNGAGSLSAAPKVLTFEGFVQACAHVAAEYAVAFDVVAKRVLKCTPKEGEDAAGRKPPRSPVRPRHIPPANTKGVAGRAVAPPERSPPETSDARDLTGANLSSLDVSTRASERSSPADSRAPPSPARSTSGRSTTSSRSESAKPPLAAPKEIPASFRDAGCELRAAFATFADPPGSSESPGTAESLDASCDAVKWGRVVRGCGLVGGSLTDDVAREIYRASGASAGEDGRMRYDAFLWACATVAGTHGVQFKEVAARVVGVAQKQRARLAEEKAKRADAGAGAGAGADPGPGDEKKKKKKKGMFSRIF